MAARLALVAVVAAPSAATGNDAALCITAARAAAAETGVPLDLLKAIMLAETGRLRAGTWEPWPWALNIAGRGYWFASAEAARAAVDAVPATAPENVDIGCFQINRRWHGHHFPDAGAMLDPMRNARHAARFLGELHAEFGSWRAAAGAYHSRDPARSRAYAQRVMAHWARADTAPDDRGPRWRGRFPLFAASAPQRGPSLFPADAPAHIPMTGAVRPLIGGG